MKLTNIFKNLDDIQINPSFRSLLQWRKERRSKQKDPAFLMPQAEEKQIAFLNTNRTQATVTWIGHATALIQLGGCNILTDPVWDNYMGFQKRLVPPGLDLNELPPIDFVCISHNHYDHLSFATLKRVKGNPVCLVPSGLGQAFSRRNLRFEEHNWWQQKLTDSLEITFVPAQHWSKRLLFDTNKSLWGGWILRDVTSNACVYFVGDSGYFKGFRELGSRFDINCVLMPIGAYEPEWFMHLQHVSPEEAVQAFIDLKSNLFIPIHFEAFKLADDIPQEALQRLRLAWQNRGLPTDGLKVLNLGETLLIG